MSDSSNWRERDPIVSGSSNWRERNPIMSGSSNRRERDPKKSFQNVTRLKPSRSNRDSNKGYEANKRQVDSHQNSKGLTFSSMKKFVEEYDANDLIIRLLCSDSFFQLINSRKEDNQLSGFDGSYSFLCLILEALAKICDTSDRLNLNEFLAKLSKFQIEDHLLAYLTRFAVLIKTERKLHLQALNDLIKFLLKSHETMPYGSREMIAMILPQIKTIVETCNKRSPTIKQSTIDSIKDLEEVNEKIISNLTLDDLKAVKAERMHAILKPPDDFRQIPVCPTSAEIHNNYEPFLRCNLIKGKYNDVDHYLDVQFRLLREDFIRPLRRGIAEYLKAIRTGDQIHKIQDIRVYSNVHIGTCDQKSISVYNARFDASKLKKVEWKNSKRLIFGSLLCLSSNNFETFCFALVAGERNPKNLYEGKFQIEFETQTLTEEFIQISPNTSFVMIESQAYFEAYRHNLLALQRFTTNNFPLNEYIINVSKEVLKPPYIDEDTVYNLSHMISSLKNKKFDYISEKLSDLKISQSVRESKNQSESDSEFKSVKVLDVNEWPNAESMGFDDSQYEAFKSALLKQFVIIQGPPGTGKTYVGLKIVQTLHLNKHVWNRSLFGIDYELLGFRLSKPILVVCYTNHALDQFLEGMLPLCHNMVRIGGRSKSVKLEKFTLNSIRQRERGVNTELSYKIICCHSEMQDIQNSILDLKYQINNCSNDLLNLQFLCDCLFDNFWFETQVEFLLFNYSNQLELALVKWLTFDDFQYQQFDEGIDQEFAQINNENFNKNNNFNFEDNYVENHENQALNGLTKQRMEFDADEDEVNYILDNRKIDNDLDEDFDDGFNDEYRFQARNRSSYNRFNTIFKANSNSLKQFSKTKINQLLIDMKVELSSNDVMTREEAVIIEDVTQLSLANRWRLYRFWVNIYIEVKRTAIERMKQLYVLQIQKLNDLKHQSNMRIIRGKNIIGMTTTGAAKFRNIIEQINPRIVVIEEAAEVLESHVITSLARNTDHLILIGDHQQLRPNPAVYELAKKYDLDVSLFERMIRNGLPYYQLKLQHRMRPCISSLLVPFIYKELHDHESVKHYENIKGISKNMFFINHTQNESTDVENKSKSNRFEAEFIVRLCEHLIYEDYETSQITILTMYSAQLFVIKQLLTKKHIFDGITANVLDNYQGEENDIILVSFVRSNLNNDIGFLKVSNRINVALSRAKKGLYCIGNFDCLSEKCDLWKNIKSYLTKIEAIGPALELHCPNHPHEKLLITNEYDFNKFPYGGCLEPCIQRLDCGHSCPKSCHGFSHEKLKCQQKCLKINCQLNHQCPETCHFDSECGPCLVKIEKIVPNCGHKIEEICSGELFCYTLCNKLLPCDHECQLACSQECQKMCPQLVTKTVDGCGHQIIEKCCGPSLCNKQCDKLLLCGHKCNLKCYESCKSSICLYLVEKAFTECGHQIITECSQNIRGLKCKSMVDIELKCGHRITTECSRNIRELKCKSMVEIELECGHKITTKCSRNIREFKCKSMVEIELECGHKITIECSQNITEFKCNSMGEIELKCGHKITAKCSQDITEFKCRSMVTIQLKCGHDFEGQCFRSLEPFNSTKYCEQKCGHQLECGHQCEGLCGDCKQSRLHVRCRQKCKRKLVCGHNCLALCGENCPPCGHRCQNGCSHGLCTHTCSEPCIPCKKECLWRCEHKRCNRLCYERCNRDICERECNRKLRCGHKCIGLCGEFCPQFCLICDKTRIKQLFGIEDMSDFELLNAKFIQLENCRHIIELNTLKSWLTSIESVESMKTCPKCKTTITQSQPFKHLIQEFFTHITDVNENYFGYSYDNEQEQENIASLIIKLIENPVEDVVSEDIRSVLNDLRQKTLGYVNERLLIKSKYDLFIIENKLNIIKHLIEIRKELSSIQSKIIVNSVSHVNPKYSNLKRIIDQNYTRMKKLLFYIHYDYLNNYQQTVDTKRELNYFFAVCNALKLSVDNEFNEECLRSFVEAFDLVLNSGPFIDDVRNEFHSSINQIVQIKGLEFKFSDTIITTELTPNNSCNLK